MSWTKYWATGGHAAQPSYSQFAHDGCSVGCGPVAWGILFAWADRQAAQGNPYWSLRWGIYRHNGGTGNNAIAPLSLNTGAKNMIRKLHDYCGTFCVGNSAATTPWGMRNAQSYLNSRTGAKVSCHWNSLGIPEHRLRRYARNSIRDRKTPAVIGTGWLNHYPVAYGYAWRRRTVRRGTIFTWYKTVTDRYFYVNQGWGGSGNGWVRARTWFSGELYP